MYRVVRDELEVLVAFLSSQKAAQLAILRCYSTARDEGLPVSIMIEVSVHSPFWS